MARMVQMIGLGGGKQDAVDPRPEQAGEQRAASDPQAIQDPRQRRFEVDQGFRSGVECRERIDQDDLAIEPREMIAKERPDHDVLVGLIAPDHHRPQRALGCGAVIGQVERRKGQRRRSRKIARHQKAARRQQAHGEAFVAAGAQIFGEQPRRRQRRLLVGGPSRMQRRKIGVPRFREPGAGPLPRQAKAFPRPFRVSLVQQRQIEQPFARIVDQIGRASCRERVCSVV